MHAYRELLDDCFLSRKHLNEPSGISLPNELHLQALWFAGQMGREFTTPEGKKVTVIQFGHWNHTAGPDFLHCAISIDGETRSGAIELDHTPEDWIAHGHGNNTDYNEVILHVVFTNSNKTRFTCTSNNRSVPMVIVPEEVLREALQIPLLSQANAHPGRCFTPLSEMHDGNIDALMRQAVQHRAAKKALRRTRTVEALGNDAWLWQALASTLGYRPNQLAMTLLAQRLPIDLLEKNLSSSESLLFGAAGFLTKEMHEKAEGETREYLRNLWEAWWQVRTEYEPTAKRKIPWKLSGIRPVNHPQRRIACLVEAARKWSLFKKAIKSPVSTFKFFSTLEHPFWSQHYTLTSKPANKRLALMGKDRVQDFLVNHILPEKISTNNSAAWEFYQKIPAPATSEKVDKASVRLFGTDAGKRKKHLRKAWQHQALLQIYQDFCLEDVSDCLTCPFPEQLRQWRG